MRDPLADVVELLKPAVRYTKLVGGAGPWGVRRAESGQPSYCVVLEGECRMTIDGEAPLVLGPDDFVLVPATYRFSMTSMQEPAPQAFERPPVQVRPGEFRHGVQEGDADVRFMIGHCVFEAPDAALLVSLLPKRLHVRGGQRLPMLVRMVDDEARQARAARDVVMARLLEVMLIEALRSTVGTAVSPGLLCGLADERIAVALRQMHDAPARAWSVAELAREAALSRSAFFERFQQVVGATPMDYLLVWRMALAKDLLRRAACSVAEVATRIGYSSANTFSVAFARHVGMTPARYANAAAATARIAPEEAALAA